jgi:tRNA 2-selenouridine synthase
MKRIERRLGSQRHREVSDIFESAFDEQIKSGSLDAYREWVAYLLKEYYDPMYDYQIQKRAEQVAFRGCGEEVLAHIGIVTAAQPAD